MASTTVVRVHASGVCNDKAVQWFDGYVANMTKRGGSKRKEVSPPESTMGSEYPSSRHHQAIDTDFEKSLSREHLSPLFFLKGCSIVTS